MLRSEIALMKKDFEEAEAFERLQTRKLEPFCAENMRADYLAHAFATGSHGRTTASDDSMADTMQVVGPRMDSSAMTTETQARRRPEAEYQ